MLFARRSKKTSNTDKPVTYAVDVNSQEIIIIINLADHNEKYLVKCNDIYDLRGDIIGTVCGQRVYVNGIETDLKVIRQSNFENYITGKETIAEIIRKHELS